MITYIHGDATNPTTKPALIVHVSNDAGGWGAGFVLALSKRWKEPENYFRKCFREGKDSSLGDVQFVKVNNEIWVANMVAQVLNDPVMNLRYNALKVCLGKVGEWAKRHDIDIHCPLFGAGLAGGDWKVIEKMIIDNVCLLGVNVYAYKF